MPDAVVIAGANGAGKTTFARQLVPTLYPTARFLNVDEIQAEAPAFAHPVAASKEMLFRLARVERTGASFVIETTLASRLYARRIQFWRTSAYHIVLHFIELPSEDDAVRRVATRVAAGGHSVPEADIRRRFHRGLVLFHGVYKPLVHEWYHWFGNDGDLRLGEHFER